MPFLYEEMIICFHNQVNTVITILVLIPSDDYRRDKRLSLQFSRTLPYIPEEPFPNINVDRNDEDSM